MRTTPVSGPLISIGPRVRKSPFFDATMRWGAKAFTVYNHMYMPTHYGDPVAEYWSLVRNVTLWDVSCQRQIIIRGPDAKPFMELLTPRDLSNCPSHRCLYVILTDDEGGIVNDAVLMHMRENEFWLSPGDGDVILWAQGVATHAGMDVEVIEGDVCPIEGGLLSYFSDMRRVDNPYTFGLDRLVNLDKKAEFIGRDALYKIHANGSIRRLVGVEIGGEPISHNEEFWHILEGGKRNGHVSRCLWSPRLEKNIGWANVRAGATSPGTRLAVTCPDGPRDAMVVDAPWFKAEKVIPPGIGDS